MRGERERYMQNELLLTSLLLALLHAILYACSKKYRNKKAQRIWGPDYTPSCTPCALAIAGACIILGILMPGKSRVFLWAAITAEVLLLAISLTSFLLYTELKDSEITYRVWCGPTGHMPYDKVTKAEETKDGNIWLYSGKRKFASIKSRKDTNNARKRLEKKGVRVEPYIDAIRPISVHFPYCFLAGYVAMAAASAGTAIFTMVGCISVNEYRPVISAIFAILAIMCIWKVLVLAGNKLEFDGETIVWKRFMHKDETFTTDCAIRLSIHACALAILGKNAKGELCTLAWINTFYNGIDGFVASLEKKGITF